MEVIIRCPNCGMELEAPSDMIGRAALCPGCQVPFVVQAEGETRASESPVATPTRATSSASSSSSAAAGSSASSSAPSTAPASSSSPPSSSSVSPSRATSRGAKETVGSAAPDAAGKPRFKGLDQSLMAELSGGAAVVPSLNDEPKSSTHDRNELVSSSSSSRSSAPPLESIPDDSKFQAARAVKPAKRERRAAKLVTEAASTSRMTLGADGQLPQLQVKETTAVEKSKEGDSESSPWVLIAAVAGSVVMSVFLLFVPSRLSVEQADVTDSIEALEEHYIGQRQPLEPYQILVRQALQSENKGDRANANSIYRRLLDMIHAERQDSNQGLTGPKLSLSEPNDRRLEEHLKVLLSR